MKKSEKPVVIVASLFLLVFGIFGLMLWIIITIVVLAMPTKPDAPRYVAPKLGNEGVQEAFTRVTFELELRATNESDPKVAAGLRQAIDLLKAEVTVVTPIVMSGPSTILQDPVVAANGQTAVADMTSYNTSHIDAPAEKVNEPLDQIVLMLYVGAFLLLGGMSLFIVYGGLADSLRLILIATMTLTMYGSGLLLFGVRAALRPAAVAFLGIGLVMIPLTGYAAVYLMQTDPHLTWFITSIVGLIAYVYALMVTKAEVVGYLVFLMWLSLAQSAVTLFGGTLQWFAWVSLALATVTQLALPYAKKYIGTELTYPFWLSSLLLVPIALIVSLGQVSTGVMELWELGMSLALGGLYCLSALISVRKLDGSPFSASAYGVSAHIFLLLSILAFTYDLGFDGIAFGYTLLGLAVMHFVAWLIIRSRPSYVAGGNYEWLLFILAIFLSYVSWVWLFESEWLVVVAAMVTVSICTLMTIVSKQQESALFATLTVFALPLLFTRALVGFGEDESSAAVLSVSYLAVTLVFALVRWLVRANRELAPFPLVGYAVSVTLAWFVAISIAPNEFFVQAAVMIATLGIILAASYLERAPVVIAAAQFVLLGIIYAGLQHYSSLIDQEILAWSAIITAAISYIYSLLSQGARGKTLLLASIVTMVVAWVTSVPITSEVWEILSPCIGFWLAALLYVEKPRLLGGAYYELLPAFIVVLAAVQLLNLLVPDLHFLVYTHLWAGYSAYVWYVLYKNGATKDSVNLAMYIFLSILTLPLVGSALSQGSYYSLLLLIQQSIVLILGIFLQQRVLSTWAAVTMIGVVMYALRSFGYLQLVIIAVLLIGYAFYRLLTQQEKP